MLTRKFFDRDPQLVAKELLGKVIRFKHQNHWLSAMIIETEAYEITEKGSHSSLGFTEKRKALFMPAGTIYMYYAHGGDSLNISCHGEGNAVLIKSGRPYEDAKTDPKMLEIMHHNAIHGRHKKPRSTERLCSGQTLLCQALGIKVQDWNQRQFDRKHFYIEDVGYQPTKVIQTTRLGIPMGRDEHLPYRFVDDSYVTQATRNPKTRIKKAK
jgi:DNA-3-methyladenine glycosylase